MRLSILTLHKTYGYKSYNWIYCHCRRISGFGIVPLSFRLLVARPFGFHILRQPLMTSSRLNSKGFSLTLSPVHEKPPSPSAPASPSTSPPPPKSPDSVLQEAKSFLHKGIAKRGTKASNISIDEDMKNMCFYYNQLEGDARSEFIFEMALSLLTNHKVIEELVADAPKSVSPEHDDAIWTRWEERLRAALQPPSYWLACQVSRLFGGVKFLVDLRRDLLTAMATMPPSASAISAVRAMDAALRDLLSLWFTVGLLDLQRITWESPCDMLQKVSEYEAVHPMRNWTDLKRRVGHYRRCFVFTHSCMPNEPLVVLHTYLTNEISNSMAKIVQPPRYASFDESSMKAGEDASLLTTAVFYSITSTQKGLQGIEFGNYMIKRVVRELKGELPHMCKFSSLSPVPGFMNWLIVQMNKAQRGDLQMFADHEMATLQKILEANTSSEVYESLRKLLKSNRWMEEPELVDTLEAPFVRLCAYYLHCEKKRGFALDSVAHFHLKNGAVMWRINWKADKSAKGLSASCGIMVNYRYFLEECEHNSREYLENSRIMCSDPVFYMAKMATEIISPSTHVNEIVNAPPPTITVTSD